MFSVRNAEGSMSIQLSDAIHMESRYTNIYAMIRHVINTDEAVSPSEHAEEFYGTRVTPIHWPFSPTISHNFPRCPSVTVQRKYALSHNGVRRAFG